MADTQTVGKINGSDCGDYALFGKAMKFAGMYGKEIRVIGKNRETLTTPKAAFLQIKFSLR